MQYVPGRHVSSSQVSQGPFGGQHAPLFAIFPGGQQARPRGVLSTRSRGQQTFEPATLAQVSPKSQHCPSQHACPRSQQCLLPHTRVYGGHFLHSPSWQRCLGPQQRPSQHAACGLQQVTVLPPLQGFAPGLQHSSMSGSAQVAPLGQHVVPHPTEPVGQQSGRASPGLAQYSPGSQHVAVTPLPQYARPFEQQALVAGSAQYQSTSQQTPPHGVSPGGQLGLRRRPHAAPARRPGTVAPAAPASRIRRARRRGIGAAICRARSSRRSLTAPAPDVDDREPRLGPDQACFSALPFLLVGPEWSLCGRGDDPAARAIDTRRWQEPLSSTRLTAARRC
jgi:hypothetical protein